MKTCVVLLFCVGIAAASVINSKRGSCTDTIKNCADYGHSVCSDANYAAWVDDNCKKFCGKCSGHSRSGSGGICFDRLTDCHSYGKTVCHNASYQKWTQDNCARYCSWC